jgi:hypothetical protein
VFSVSAPKIAPHAEMGLALVLITNHINQEEQRHRRDFDNDFITCKEYG